MLGSSPCGSRSFACAKLCCGGRFRLVNVLHGHRGCPERDHGNPEPFPFPFDRPRLRDARAPAGPRTSTRYGRDDPRGLSRSPKRLEPYLFYDRRGSELFEQICALDEYYVTRTERRILEANASKITSQWTDATTVYELGSGSSEKTELLLAQASRRSTRICYVPTDISESALRLASQRLSKVIPGHHIRAFVADFESALDAVFERFRAPRYGIFLGGNIGNFDAGGALSFLRRVSNSKQPS
ncbi:MAG: L-histidine N(alpha)-methyltransferase, partial [Myxococcales bacterium]|nr:L-histidine N(alpha)-methyltransferase [Myxococcales bacterium]